jgi:hypothetical protein
MLDIKEIAGLSTTFPRRIRLRYSRIFPRTIHPSISTKSQAENESTEF